MSKHGHTEKQNAVPPLSSIKAVQDFPKIILQSAELIEMAMHPNHRYPSTGLDHPISTVTDMRAYVGRTGAVRHGTAPNAAWFAVSVLDVRERWGETDVLVTPVTGHGSFWVRAEGVDWA